jgi:hypothetical protein
MVPPAMLRATGRKRINGLSVFLLWKVSGNGESLGVVLKADGTSCKGL